MKRDSFKYALRDAATDAGIEAVAILWGTASIGGGFMAVENVLFRFAPTHIPSTSDELKKFAAANLLAGFAVASLYVASRSTFLPKVANIFRTYLLNRPTQLKHG
jgi:hypothetical protein